MGNMETGIRVFYVSQIHGSEMHSTEAVLALAEEFATDASHHDLLRKFDILLLVRANPDSGEPFADNLEDDYIDYLTRAKFYSDQDAFVIRETLDPCAGGAFGLVDGNPLSEPGFFGTVGRGYNGTRYVYTKLNAAIRPVEVQAIVAVLHVFKPEFVADAHGDLQKSLCPLDFSTLVPGRWLGILPSIECADPAPAFSSLVTVREFMAEVSLPPRSNGNYEQEYKGQAISSFIEDSILADGGFVGGFLRFSQIQLGTGISNDASITSGAAALGINGLLIEVPVWAVSESLAYTGYTNS